MSHCVVSEHECLFQLVKFLEERAEAVSKASAAAETEAGVEAEAGAGEGAESSAGAVAELVSLQREVLERACGVHHPDKPELHLYWAHFEEAHGQPARAADILDRIEKTCPTLVQIQYRYY